MASIHLWECPYFNAFNWFFVEFHFVSLRICILISVFSWIVDLLLHELLNQKSVFLDTFCYIVCMLRFTGWRGGCHDWLFCFHREWYVKVACTKKSKLFKILKNPHETFVLWLGQKWKCIFDFKKWWLTVAIFTAYYSDKRIVDFIISISNSTWLEAEGTCQAMNGTLWGEDKLDLLLYLRILAHQKISWYKLY